jgi:DNA-binding MarR family transcriptional regulator
MTASTHQLVRHASCNEPSAHIREWREEFEKLAWFLGRIGPDDICCGGLTPRQCAILRVLTSSKGERLSDLADAMGITPSAMTRVLERLEKQGLLRRVHGGMEDGRASTIAITSQGQHTRALLDQFMIQRTREILEAIPLDSRTEILAAVRKLNKAFAVSGCCQLDPVGKLRKCRARPQGASSRP